MRYESIGVMMKQEKEMSLIDYKKDNSSGCRTLLRLHRALQMVSLILRNVASEQYGEKLSTIVYEAYNGSPLPSHHPWVSKI